MHAINIIPSASSNSLEVCSRSVPDPHPGEVLIKVHAAGVNRPDIMQRKGLYPPPEGASDILGLGGYPRIEAVARERHFESVFSII